MFFMELTSLTSNNGTFVLLFRGIFKLSDGVLEPVISCIALAVLMVVTVSILLTTLFLYKKRMLQIRLCGFCLGLLIGITGMPIYLGLNAAKVLSASYSFSIALAFPVVSVILVILAMRAIGKDEALVRSLNRIR
jgi:hypothetical protein